MSGYQNVLSAQNDAFISVFDPTLSTLVYSSLFGEPQVSNAGVGFGGASFTFGEAVTVDAAGNFYLAGTTEDASLPTTSGAYEASASSCGTVTNNVLLNCPFVAKFSPVGSGTPSLVYGTYLGHTVISSYGDLMTGIAADAAGDAYVVGFTNQATFPTTAGAYQTTCGLHGVDGNTNTAMCGRVHRQAQPLRHGAAGEHLFRGLLRRGERQRRQHQFDGPGRAGCQWQRVHRWDCRERAAAGQCAGYQQRHRGHGLALCRPS